MFDEKRVAHIAKQGKAESWPYPKVFHALKEAGVISHEVSVEDFRSIYSDGSHEWPEPVPEEFQPLKIASQFSEEAVQEALKRRINHETTYVEFLGNIAAAGVVSYKVDMESQTVTYKDRDGKDSFVQNIPPNWA